MEKRQLDLNAPLLSARRYSSPRNSSELVQPRKPFDKRTRQQSLPLNKSDWESEDITKPGSVPFNWEQSPGRPKNEARTRFPTPNGLPNSPKLPPGRFISAEIPRLPPGRQLSGPSKYPSGDRSRDHNLSRGQLDSFGDHAILLAKLNDSLECNDESSSESEDDTYSDALNALSLTETCSVSGISGARSSGKFLVDKQTRDFMMDRFLPAAKAVVLETTKKSTAIDPGPKEVKKVVSGEIITKPLLRQYGSEVLPPYYRHPDFDNVESDEDEEDLRSSAVVPVIKKAGKSWGITLPKICVKNSLCMLNPLPSMMKSKSRPTTPSAGEERRMRRNAVSGPLEKNGCQVPPPKKKYHSGSLSSNGESHQLLNTRDSPRSGLSPLRRYRSGNVSPNISPYRNESPKSAFREGAGFLGLPNKEVDNFNASKIASSRKMFMALQDVSRHNNNQINEKGSSGPMPNPVEKTVYVDSISKKTSLKTDLDDEKKIAIKRFLSGHREMKAQECDDVACDLKLGAKEEKEEKLELLGNSNGGEFDHLPLKSPLHPPLPKSPSESWLWRTLPSIPLGNPFGHSRRNSQVHESKKQGRKSSSVDPKWETIVKTTNTRHDHARYSQELIPQGSYRQSKS